MRRVTILVGMAVILNLALVSPALAAPPTNDTFAGREVINALPFADSVDTTEATTDADDVEANADCGAPFTDASVWYEFAPTEDAVLLVDVSASTYLAGVIVVTGDPGGFELVTCGPDSVAFAAFTGQTYRLLAFDDQGDGGGNGGTLEITIEQAPPPPEITLTVDPIGHFDAQTGSATVSGTVTCTGENIEFAAIDVQLRQTVGRFAITGFGSTDLPCDGDTHEWSVEVFADNGLFKGGHAVAITFAFACDPIFCGEGFEEATVRLRG